MKVIVAGLPKTGTTSMATALEELGFAVLDFFYHYHIHEEEWEKIMETGGTAEDFQSMYEEMDVVTDIPACLYWEKICEAFPDCKVILTLRDNEDIWFTSYKNQIEAWKTRFFCFLYFISPTFHKMIRFVDDTEILVFGAMETGFLYSLLFGSTHFNPLSYKLKYRMYASHVMQNVPKEKLLVFNVKQGWKPLCSFLNVEIPSSPFPHKNIKGAEVQDFMDNDPLYSQIRMEMVISTSLIIIVFALFFYWLHYRYIK